MANRRNKHKNREDTPKAGSKKQAKPRPKKLYFIALAMATVSMFLILTGMSAISREPSAKPAGGNNDEPNYTGVEPATFDTAGIFPIGAPPETPPAAVYAQPANQPQPGPNKQQAAQTKTEDRQWIDHQRMAYMSSGIVPDWPLPQATTAGPAPAPKAAVVPYDDSLQQDYLDLLPAQRQSDVVQLDFFKRSMSAPGSLSSTRQPQRAPYKIPAGTIIPCVMITGINSDLPGNVTAQVSENVYDFVNPYVCLIPQGSRVFGEYNSSVGFGQKRVQVRWTGITYPDGSSLNLEGMQGVDKEGYSGQRDKYYPHYGRMLAAAILTSTFTLLPDLILEETIWSWTNSGTTINTGDNNYNDTNSELARVAAEAAADMGRKFFDKALDAHPTIQIRPGTRVNIQANADILFHTTWQQGQ